MMCMLLRVDSTEDSAVCGGQEDATRCMMGVQLK